MARIHLLFRRYFLPLVIAIIFLFGAFLRLNRLAEVPVQVYWDGAAFSYNAFSILHTGRDEYGTFMPILFRSFNDYKMPGNIYLSVIPVAIFGLNAFSTRFTTSFFGSLAVLVGYFLFRELFLLNDLFAIDKKKRKYFALLLDKKFGIGVAVFGMLLFAISPWAIQFSRAEFEANVGMFFVVTGGMFFLRFVRIKSLRSILFSMISFGVSFYMYRSVLIFVPLLIVGLYFIFRKEILKQKRYFVIGFLVLLAIALPFVPVILSPQGMIRSNQVGIQNNSFDEFYQAAKSQQQAGNTVISKIIYNRRFVLARIFIENYLSHFSPDYLFFKGDANGRHGPRSMGILYIWEIPFILIGLLLLFTLNKQVRNTVLLWILLAPLPAAVTVPTPHALRTLNILPMPMFITALGVMGTYWFVKSVWKKVFAVVMVVVVAGFFVAYLQNYYGFSARVTSADWADGYKQLMQYVMPRENQYNKIVISGHYWNPYIFALYYKRYDPATYQQSGSRTGFDKYLFGGTRWEAGQHELEGVDIKAWAKSNNILVALSPEEYPSQQANIHEVTRIYNHNSDLVFIVGEIK